MARAHLSSDEFFDRLSVLLEAGQQKSHGSIYLTQKRLSYELDAASSLSTDKVADDPTWDLHPPQPMPVIIRATDGKDKKRRAEKVRFSTVVQPDQLAAFYARYAEVCKGGMQALKKRDRSKRKKDKAKKRKLGGEDKKG
ncbi:hypothetical protein LTR66_002030 [Elasticomyces elasticus]|nr:hypothetical protein LTR66_002030 [Elasticomyces elasticus]